jgi:hypothetical protein
VRGRPRQTTKHDGYERSLNVIDGRHTPEVEVNLLDVLDLYATHALHQQLDEAIRYH